MAPQRACGSPLPARRRFLEAGLRVSCGLLVWGKSVIGTAHGAGGQFRPAVGRWVGAHPLQRIDPVPLLLSLSVLALPRSMASLLALMAIAARSRTSHSALKIALEK
jgi:hypothetical protein